MSVWFAIPSKRRAAEAERCLSLWRALGYRLALFRDAGDEPIKADMTITGRYPGYATAVNALCHQILKHDQSATWIVSGGDDMEPDRRDPVQIAEECTAHFGGTFGVMQPTGDRWTFGGAAKPCSELVAGSPWLGREWCRRMYSGIGPLCSDYWHYYEDEELQRVAEKLGVFWQRKDVTHLHHHVMRQGNRFGTQVVSVPDGTFELGKKTFFERRRLGFPGHEPLPA